jgi:predicted benzoate:H+ symporter BenE
MKKELLLVGLVMVVTLLLSTIPAMLTTTLKAATLLSARRGRCRTQPGLPALTGGPVSG